MRLIWRISFPLIRTRAIQFTGDDMGSDQAMMVILLYIVILIMAFVFGITTSNTISREANVIGTLWASGYTKNELIRHYMTMPTIVTLVSALIGIILGYTLLEGGLRRDVLRQLQPAHLRDHLERGGFCGDHGGPGTSDDGGQLPGASAKAWLVAAEVSAAGFEPTKAETRHAAKPPYPVLYPVPLTGHFPECG